MEKIDEALAVHQILLNSKAAAATTVKALRDWFLDKNNGKVCPRPQLWGSSQTMFDNENDLVALRVPADQDRLSEFILNHLGGFFKVCLFSQIIWNPTTANTAWESRQNHRMKTLHISLNIPWLDLLLLLALSFQQYFSLAP
jgi:hypothetical protein